MVIKYLHKEQPNTQSEQYLKKKNKYERVLDKCDNARAYLAMM